jgi:hypothetical protein
MVGLERLKIGLGGYFNRFLFSVIITAPTAATDSPLVAARDVVHRGIYL